MNSHKTMSGRSGGGISSWSAAALTPKISCLSMGDSVPSTSSLWLVLVSTLRFAQCSTLFRLHWTFGIVQRFRVRPLPLLAVWQSPCFGSMWAGILLWAVAGRKG